MYFLVRVHLPESKILSDLDENEISKSTACTP